MRKSEDIFIGGTGKTPQVEFNHQTGELVLTGRSIPENASIIYEPLVAWTRKYIKFPCTTTNLHLKLEYFNVATLRWIAKIIRGLSKINLPDKSLFIHLYFDIEDYESQDADDLREIFNSLIARSVNKKLRIGIRTYGLAANRKIVKGPTILI